MGKLSKWMIERTSSFDQDPSKAAKILSDMVEAAGHQIEQKFESSVAQKMQSKVASFASAVEKTIREKINSLENNNEILIFPNGTRYHKHNLDYVDFFVEQSPIVRTINFVYNEEEYRFSLSLPYVYFKYSASFHDGKWKLSNHVYTYFRPTPLKSAKDMLFQSWFTNANSSGEICNGDIEWGCYRTIQEAYEEHQRLYWGSYFNNDLKDQLCSRFNTDNTLTAYKLWENAYKKNPLKVLQCNAFYHGRTFESICLEQDKRSENVYQAIKDAMSNSVKDITSSIDEVTSNNHDLFRVRNTDPIFEKFLREWEKELDSEIREDYADALVEEIIRIEQRTSTTATNPISDFSNPW